MKKFTRIILFLFMGLPIATNAQAKDSVGKTTESADEIAEKLSNPTAAIGSLSFLTDFKTYDGNLPDASNQTSWTISFQPSLPKTLGESGYNLLFRPLVPLIINQPVYTGLEGFEGSGVQLGNIAFDFAVGTTSKSGILSLVGVAGTLPSATSDDLRAQWAFGPEVLLGYVNKKIIIGALISQQWGVEGLKRNTDVLGGQYFLFFPIGNGRVLGAGPTFSYDWNSNNLTFPVGFGYSSVTIAGKTPLKYGVQLYYYVAQPDAFGPLWQIRLQLSPVVKLPW